MGSPRTLSYPELLRVTGGEIHQSPSFWYSTAHGTFFAIFLEMVISLGR